MAPHAVLPEAHTPSTRSSSVGSRAESHLSQGEAPAPSPYLRHVPADELHDLVCVGFGPASLAIAVALHDSFEHANSGEPKSSALPKVAFLERQPSFAWHAGMQIPGAKMQISFLKDLATLRNPRSEFTFVNYLHRVNRLVQFSNVSTFLPRRVEYEAYMRWCATHFDDVVSYGQEVLSVDPDHPTSSSKPVRSFTITTRSVSTGATTTLRTKNVCIAVGGRPRLPPSLPQSHPRVIHSSQYQRFLSTTPLTSHPHLRIAVIGAGQSAAEIFSDLPSRFPACTSYLLIKSTALRPSDDSPFVNEVFDPDRVSTTFATPAERRAAAIAADKATNYGVVRLELLEHIYEELYAQRVALGNDEESWPRRIVHSTAVESAVPVKGGEGLRLQLRSAVEEGQASSLGAELDVDLVFVASGYERDMHQEMLKGCRGLLGEGQERFEVGRDYGVVFGRGKVADGAGVWLQGCNERTHGLSDTLLSILAVRGGEVVSSVFGR